MGKHEPMSAKAIANRIKAKGLQKIKYYCEMCKKQCRDDNGFKCHIMSESHQRQALIVSDNPDKFVNEFSNEVMDGFMYLLKTRYRSKRILANTVFQEYIKDREHTHLNSTRWTSLTEFANWLGEKGLVKVDDSERGVMVTYIDRDPETLRRQEIDTKRQQRAQEMLERNREQVERQREAAKLKFQELDVGREAPKPITIEKIEIEKPPRYSKDDEGAPIATDRLDKTTDDADKAGSCNNELVSPSNLALEPTSDQVDVIERPVFQVKTVTLKATVSSGYKPPPPKTKVVRKQPISGTNKRLRLL